MADIPVVVVSGTADRAKNGIKLPPELSLQERFLDKRPVLSYNKPDGGSAGTKRKGRMDMSFDVKAKVEELVGKLQKDPATLKSFQDDPIKTVEKLTGVDLPDEQLQPLVAGIKAKLAASDLGGKLEGLKKLF